MYPRDFAEFDVVILCICCYQSIGPVVKAALVIMSACNVSEHCAIRWVYHVP